jgi:hypothetical protein
MGELLPLFFASCDTSRSRDKNDVPQVTDINHQLGVVGYHVRVATDIKLPLIVTFQLGRTLSQVDRCH